MKTKRSTSMRALLVLVMALALVASACGRDSTESTTKTTAAPDGTTDDTGGGEPSPVPGFDGTTIRLGVLTPETGPAEVIGTPLTNGNKAYWDWVNSKGGLEGYKVELVIKDNQYTESETIAQYNQIKDDVVAFQQILGTAPLDAVLPQITKDGMFAGPATLDAPWYDNQNLMPILATYQIQAINGIDYYVKEMGGEGTTMCTLTSDNPYGAAGKEGADYVAGELGVDYATQQTFTSGQADFTAQISALQNAKCDFVWLTALPTETIPIFKRSIEVGFAPTWMAQSPAWIRLLPGLVGDPQYLADHAYFTIAGAEWGDTSNPGMKEMLEAKDEFAPDQAPDPYFAFGWLQAEAMAQILTNAIRKGDLSREGILDAAAATTELTFNGLVDDQVYGAPADRRPGQDTTIVKVTPDTADTNGSLTLVAPDSQNYVSEYVAGFEHE